MDVRDNIIKKVMGALVKVGQEVSDIVQDTLIMVLNDYEIQERCTEVAVLDTAPESMLKKFIATKRLKGLQKVRLPDIMMQTLSYCSSSAKICQR